MANANFYETVTIAISTSLSLAIDLTINSGVPVGVQMPAAWDAANLTFQGSFDGTTYRDVYDSNGTEVTVTAAASRYILLAPASFAGFRFIKVRSGTTGTAVAQTAARTFWLIVRPIA